MNERKNEWMIEEELERKKEWERKRKKERQREERKSKRREERNRGREGRAGGRRVLMWLAFLLFITLQRLVSRPR